MTLRWVVVSPPLWTLATRLEWGGLEWVDPFVRRLWWCAVSGETGRWVEHVGVFHSDEGWLEWVWRVLV